jgi:hypothetical protein
VQLYTGAQINFGDLTPYLTYSKNDSNNHLFHKSSKRTKNVGTFSQKANEGDKNNLFFVPGPVWEVVEPEERDGVGVDGDGDGENADDVHDHARLHHVHGLQRAMAEDDGVGSCRHRQGEGVRANNP